MSPDSQLRLAVFLVILAAMMLWEWLAPRRTAQRRRIRWPGNLGLAVFNAVLLILAPLSAVGASLFAQINHFGLFPWLELSLWPSILLSLVLLDMMIYWQHRLLHTRLVWPIHRMHHTDTAIDVTTALRFHPLEMILSMLLKAAFIVLLGVPLLGAIAFEIMLNGTAMFNHGNVRLPRVLDKVLRLVIVTPDMHRVHHAVHDSEFNSNYGFSLSIWDRMFGSYTPQPRDGHTDMQIGQHDYRERPEARLDKLLTQPFR